MARIIAHARELSLAAGDANLRPMGWMRSMGPAAFATIALLALAGPALAQPTCPADVVGCYAEDADWQWENSLFDTVDFDTGWVPSGSALQLRFTFQLAGSTQVEVGGTPTMSWPPPIEARVPGRPGTGYLNSNYGLEIRLYFRFSVTVAGVSFDFEEEIDIPFIPMDLRAFAETGWDPFIFPPADPIMISDATEDIELVSVGLGSIVSIPGVDGGLRVDTNLELDTFYQTLRIVMDDGDSPEITMPDGVSILAPTGATANYGPARDVLIRPEGILEYILRLNIIPTIFLDVLGTGFTFPVAMLPIQLADLDDDVIFDDVLVHVPLPDVDLRPRMIDFGDVEVGDTATELLTIENAGEAELEVLFDPIPTGFTAPTELLTLAPMSTRRVEVECVPTDEGPMAGMLFANTNDPDSPTVLVQLRCNGLVPPQPDMGPADMFVGVDAGDPGGVAGGACGCRTAGHRTRAPWLLGLFGLLLFVRRRR